MPQERESILDGKQPHPDGSVPVVSQGPLARRVLVAGRGLCRLCQPIAQVTDPDPHRMAPLTATTAGPLQPELSVPTRRAVRHFGVAVMPGAAASGIL
jgi:hypothetical protein